MIAGYFALFFGLLWTVWPKVLRWWLIGQASWVLYWVFIGYLYVPLASFAEQFGLRGWAGLAIGLILIGMLLRGVISKLAAQAPLVAFRAIGLLNLLGGIYLVFFAGRVQSGH